MTLKFGGHRPSSLFRLLLDPNASAEGGNPPEEEREDENPTPQKPERTFSQADVERMVKDRLRKAEREKREQTKKLETIQSQFDELTKKFEALQNPPTPPASDDLQGQLNLANERHRREVEGLQKQIRELQDANAKETNRRMEIERDKEIDAALVAADCKDLVGGRRFIKPQVIYDDVEDRWAFELAAGGTVSIKEGVAEDLPDYLRKPAIERGGSGSTNGDRSKSRAASRLEAEEKKLEKLALVAKESGGKTNNVQAYLQQKNLVATLRRDLAAVK